MAEIVDLSLQKLRHDNEVDGIDINIEKVHTNMVLPSTYSVSLVTTTVPPTSYSRGECLCQQGFFLHWTTKECVPQKPWGFECGFYPRQQQNRVCQDGLSCKTLNVTDTYESSGKYKGWASTAPATCEYCTAEDDCKTGSARHLKDCVRTGDMKRWKEEAIIIMLPEEAAAEEKELEPWEDDEVFEAWGRKGAEDPEEDKDGLKPFGRQEPKMCVTVKVTIPALTVHDKSMRIIEAKINTTLEVLANATQKADANATATAKTVRKAVVEAQAEANASYNATAAAEATYTAYAEATDTATAVYKAVATAEAKRKVKDDGSKAQIASEATAAARSNGKASAKEIANATRTTVTAQGAAGATVKLKQTGHGKAEAEAERNATVHIQDTATVTKKRTVEVEGVGTMTKEFKATATAKAIVETKACISARQAKQMLSQDSLRQSGVPFARAVYKKAEREAYAQAKEKATSSAINLATKAAKDRIDSDIEAQVAKYTEEHRSKLEKIALEDAMNSTVGVKKMLQEAAVKEAMAQAVDKVKARAPLVAQMKADAEVKKAAEDEATKEATRIAQKEARDGLKRKAMVKAREEAQENANEKAKANAFQQAKKAAEDAAKEKAVKEAREAAEEEAEKQAKAAAEDAATKRAVAKASRIAAEGADGASKDKDKESEEKPSESKADAKPEKSGPWMLLACSGLMIYGSGVISSEKSLAALRACGFAAIVWIQERKRTRTPQRVRLITEMQRKLLGSIVDGRCIATDGQTWAQHAQQTSGLVRYIFVHEFPRCAGFRKNMLLALAFCISFRWASATRPARQDDVLHAGAQDMQDMQHIWPDLRILPKSCEDDGVIFLEPGVTYDTQVGLHPIESRCHTLQGAPGTQLLCSGGVFFENKENVTILGPLSVTMAPGVESLGNGSAFHTAGNLRVVAPPGTALQFRRLTSLVWGAALRAGGNIFLEGLGWMDFEDIHSSGALYTPHFIRSTVAHLKFQNCSSVNSGGAMYGSEGIVLDAGNAEHVSRFHGCVSGWKGGAVGSRGNVELRGKGTILFEK
eukprot:s2229_g7.t2